MFSSFYGALSAMLQSEGPPRFKSSASEDMADLLADEQCSNEKSCQTDKPCVHPPKAPSRVYNIEPGDPPLLQRQLHTSKSGIHQIIECFRSGTTQLKHILLKEVDTIFECKLCRSLFRGLPNLITHKEFYCFSRCPDPEDASSCLSLPGKDLLEAIYPPDSPQYVVTLEPIESNQNAMFQQVTSEDGTDLPPQSHSSAHSSTHSSAHSTSSLQGPTQAQEEDGGGVDSESEDGDSEAEEREEGRREERAEEADGDDGVVLDGEEDEEEDSDEDSDEDEEEGEVGAEREEGEEAECGEDVGDVVITCCLCGKDFSTRRGVRRHCRKMHRKRMEELRRFTETRTVPISLLSVVKDRQTGQVHPPSLDGRRCPICFKTFATKANVRRHFDEVHRGLRRDLITPDIATKPGQLDTPPPRHGPMSIVPRTMSLIPHYNLEDCKCLLCKRTYSSQARLKRHMRVVHKINADGSSGGGVNRPREAEPSGEGRLRARLKFTMGFDFKKLFCKLCKRQFSSRQNLAKHIELHTDNGSDIFIKFYRCPICHYESRRKRDVLRHVTVVHKKNTAYLAKILPVLESRAVKKPAEAVLAAHTQVKADVNGQHNDHAPSRRHDPAAPSTAVTRKQSMFTRRGQSSNGSHQEDVHDSSEVRVTKNFSLHACDMCGRAFAKKVYLESHKRSHRNVAHSEGRTAGVSTRSKSLL
ncbi:zinc finger protein 800b isoform X2 [Brachyhypopomus gauderio]